MTATLPPMIKFQPPSPSGVFPGGKVYTYVSGTSTPQATYQSDGTTPNTNPIILDANGACDMRLGSGMTYKINVLDSSGSQATGWPVDNISSLDNIPIALDTAMRADLASTMVGKGDALIGVLQPESGDVATTQSEFNSRFRFVTEKMTVAQKADVSARTALVDVGTAINAAILALSNAGGGTLLFPSGKYLHSIPLLLKKNVVLQGYGVEATILTSAHTGDGIQSTWPINSSTNVYSYVRDMTIQNTNGSNTGGGFSDVGGSDWDLCRVKIKGFKYGAILDQSELADIDACIFESQLQSCVWLVNGADHTATAGYFYTNRISLTRNQFNIPGGVAVVDDGGVSHVIERNNFNGGTGGLRYSGCTALRISGNEFEGATNNPITSSNLTLSGVPVGSSYASVEDNNLSAVAGKSCIKYLTGSGSLYLKNNWFATDTYALEGSTLPNTIVSLSNTVSGGGVMFDAVYPATFLFSADCGSISRSSVQALKRASVTYSANMTPNATQGNYFELTATNATAFIINAPTGALNGQRVTIKVINASGGALGVATWTGYKMAAWTQPANGYSRSVDFMFDGTWWYEVYRSSSDIPN